MMDYSENIIAIAHLRKKAHEALLRRDWATAVDLADQIIVASRGIKDFCLEFMDQNDMPAPFTSKPL